MVNLPPVSRLVPSRDESDEVGVTRKLQELDGHEVQLFVYREENRGERPQPLVLMVRGSETCFPSFTHCLLSDRKSVIHLQIESGKLSCEILSWSRAGIMVLNAELKSTNMIVA